MAMEEIPRNESSGGQDVEESAHHHQVLME